MLDLKKKDAPGDRSGQQKQRTLERYQRQVEQKAEQQQRGRQLSSQRIAGPDEPPMSAAPTGGPADALGDNRFANDTPNFEASIQGANRPQQPGMGGGANGIVAGFIAPAPPTPSALASLDVELPTRGKRFLLVTPRGDVQVHAQAVSTSLTQRTWRLLLLAAVVAAGLSLTSRLRRPNAAAA